MPCLKGVMVEIEAKKTHTVQWGRRWSKSRGPLLNWLFTLVLKSPRSFTYRSIRSFSIYWKFLNYFWIGDFGHMNPFCLMFSPLTLPDGLKYPITREAFLTTLLVLHVRSYKYSPPPCLACSVWLISTWWSRM